MYNCILVSLAELGLGVAVDEPSLGVAVVELGSGVAVDDLGLGVAVEDFFFHSPVSTLDASFKGSDVTQLTRGEGAAF